MMKSLYQGRKRANKSNPTDDVPFFGGETCYQKKLLLSL